MPERRIGINFYERSEDYRQYEHPRRMKCPTCDGRGVVRCGRCNGTGVDQHDVFGRAIGKARTCPACKGARKVECPNCHGKGYILV